jgi:hypothetical protein
LTLTLDTADPEPPEANPDSGIYSMGEVELMHPEWLASAAGTPVKLFYTLDGTAPGGASRVYDGMPILLPEGETHLEAVAIDEAGNASGVTAVNYTIDTIAPGSPALTPGSQYCFSDEVTVTVNTDELQDPSGTAVQVHYAIGSIDSPPPDPGAGSPIFPSSIDVDRNSTVKAIAIDGAGNASGVVSEQYTFLEITPGQELSCRLSYAAITVDVEGFFYTFNNQTLTVYITDGSVQVPCTIDETSIVTGNYNLHLIIVRSDLEQSGIGVGTQTLVITAPNGDSVSTPITILE